MNPLVHQAIVEDLPIKVSNKKSELPGRLGSFENIEINEEYLGNRPTLGEQLGTEGSDVLLANSDVFFERGFFPKLSQCKSVLPGLSFSGRRFDIFSEETFSKNIDVEKLKKRGFLQSSQTLDYFYIRAEHFQLIKLLKGYLPGTVGFDIRLAHTLNSHGSLADITDALPVFHRNHETFKEIFFTSILLEANLNIEFIQSRAVTGVRKRDKLTRGSLSYCAVKLKQNNKISNSAIQSFLSASFEKILIRLANNLEFYTFKINKSIFSRINYKLGILVISRRLKLILVYPIIGSTSIQPYGERLLECIREKWRG